MRTNSFFKTYAFGTQEEIDRYIKNKKDNEKDFNIGILAEGLVGLLFPLPFLVDATSRVVYGCLVKKASLSRDEFQRVSSSPGIVGWIREYVER